MRLRGRGRWRPRRCCRPPHRSPSLSPPHPRQPLPAPRSGAAPGVTGPAGPSSAYPARRGGRTHPRRSQGKAPRPRRRHRHRHRRGPGDEERWLVSRGITRGMLTRWYRTCRVRVPNAVGARRTGTAERVLANGNRTVSLHRENPSSRILNTLPFSVSTRERRQQRITYSASFDGTPL